MILPLITLPYILRTIGMGNYGVYAYVYVLIQYFLLLNAYGFNYSATKQIAQNREDAEYINRIYNAIVACRLILLIVGIAIFVLLSPFLLNTVSKYWMFLMGTGVVLGDIFGSVWLFQGMEKMRYLTIVNVISKVVFALFIFIFIREPDDYVYIILLNSFGFLLSGLLSYIIARRQFRIKYVRPRWEEIKFQFKEGASLFGSTLGINLYRNANIFILNFFVSEVAVGIYATAEKVIKALQMITVPIAQALFPHLGNKFKSQTIKQNLKILFRVGKVYSIVLLLESVITVFVASEIIRVISGGGFEEAASLVKIMSVVILFGGLNYVIGMVGLVNLNRQKDFFIAVMISGIVSILFLISTVSFWGIKSAALSLVVSEILLFGLCIFSIRRLISDNRKVVNDGKESNNPSIFDN